MHHCHAALQSDTDLYELAKKGTKPTSLAFAPDGSRFAVTSTDSHVRVFQFATGKLKREYDESLRVFDEAQRAGTLKLDSIDFGRRAAVERELHVRASPMVVGCTVPCAVHWGVECLCAYRAQHRPHPATLYSTTRVTSCCTLRCAVSRS